MELIQILKEYGACSDLQSEEQINELLFTERGIEFLEDAELPIDLFRDYPVEHIYTDTSVRIENESVLLVNSTADIVLSEVGLYKIILMHGSKAKIKASNYAVVKVACISGKYKLEKDSTVIILK